mmetsp:Transcript_70023/g.221934  ORF Transcript_70023/g.221934 Transcript_70023/m.221934 type:complete len:229 (-) Transcript_70023:1500-2186(-)
MASLAQRAAPLLGLRGVLPWPAAPVESGVPRHPEVLILDHHIPVDVDVQPLREVVPLAALDLVTEAQLTRHLQVHIELQPHGRVAAVPRARLEPRLALPLGLALLRAHNPTGRPAVALAQGRQEAREAAGLYHGPGGVQEALGHGPGGAVHARSVPSLLARVLPRGALLARAPPERNVPGWHAGQSTASSAGRVSSPPRHTRGSRHACVLSRRRDCSAVAPVEERHSP